MSKGKSYPKAELELNENKIPKALAQHSLEMFRVLDNNKPVDAKEEKKEAPKESESNKAQGKLASDKPASVQQVSRSSKQHPLTCWKGLNEMNGDPETFKPSSEEVPTARKS